MEKKRITTLKYLSMMLAALSAKNVEAIDEETVSSPERIDRILDILLDAWRAAEANEDMQYASDLLNIYGELGVSVGTCQHDSFTSRLRQLQPGYLGVSNPYYVEFRPTVGIERDALATPSQKRLAEESANVLLFG